MNILRKIVCIVFFVFFCVLLFGQGSIAIYSESYLETSAACPKTDYQYWVDTKPNYGNYEWKITGGSFKHFGQNVKEINLPNISSVIVMWDNVKSSGGNAPKGTITLNVYNKDQPSNIIDKGKREQEIKSLKDLIPPSLSSSASPPVLKWGEQQVKVFLIGAFNFPGIMKNGFPVPVTQYEWQIPAGWRAKTGSATSSGTYMTSTAEINLITDTSSGGQVRVRGVNDCVGSGDYSEYTWMTFTRNVEIEFLNYPQTVPLGEVGTYEFSVLLMSGVLFKWEAPTGWSINGAGNTYTGGNVVQITTSECPTDQKVKVSMVQGDIVSPSVEFPTTITLPPINSPTGEIRQYQPATFSLNMPDDNIVSVEWLVNGNSVGEARNTSSLSFRINKWGKVKISAKLTLEGCSPVSIPEIEVDVVKAPDPVISGPSSVCDQATYTIQNFDQLPEGTTVQWSTSQINLAILSGQGSGTVTFRRLRNGINQIFAQINLSNDSITISSGQISVGIPPSPTRMNGIRDGQIFGRNGMYRFSTDDYPSVIYEWTVHGGRVIEGQGTSHVTVLTQNVTGSTPVYFNVAVRAGNDCGWSSALARYGYVVSQEGGVFSVYPNPAMDMVTVKLEEEQPDEVNLSTHRDAMATGTGSYEIQLWSSSAMLRRYTTDQPIYQISLSGLPSGIYFVRVIKDGQTYTEKLMKK